MSTSETSVHARISGHTNGNGSRLDAHVEPSIAMPRRSQHVRMMPSHDGNGRTASLDETRSITDLVRELSTESGDLFRQEIELAKAEMREKMNVFTRGAVSMGVGGAVLFCALLCGLAFADAGLTVLLAQGMSLAIAVWLAPLILMFALGGAGWVMIQGARKRMADEGLAMRRTAATLKADKRWAQEKAHEVKEDVTHVR